MKQGRSRSISRVTAILVAALCAAFTLSLHAQPRKPSSHTSKTKHTVTQKSTSSSRGAKGRKKNRKTTAASRAKTAALKRAFTASSQLRPMAQQLSSLRTSAAYAGVLHYAQSHTGEASAAAYLALGHAYLLDRRFPEAVKSLHAVTLHGKALNDYADYLAAQSLLQAGQFADAAAQLNGFAEKYPDSIFTGNLPVLMGTLQTQAGDPQAALRTLQPALSTPIGTHADFQFALARAYQVAGDASHAAGLYHHIYATLPLSNEAAMSRTQLQEMSSAGHAEALSYAERESHANALLAAKRYSDAANEFHALAAALQTDSLGASAGSRNRAQANAAYADFRHSRHVNRSEVDRLEDGTDESGALRLYLLMEDARSRNDDVAQRNYVDQLAQRFPSSRWRDEALFSSGNMYLLNKDYPSAIGFFLTEATTFPKSNYAPYCHWKAGWLNYRLQNYPEAARLFEEQIAHYAGGQEIPGALYWRARIYEEQEHNAAAARAYYGTLLKIYQGAYYSLLARTRVANLADLEPQTVPLLTSLSLPKVPEITDVLPEDDEHLVKARLLANAGLNEYMAAEIQMSDTSASWGALAQAQIFASYGENARAMRILKSALPQYFSAPFNSIPVAYWGLLFPLPYAPQLRADSESVGLDPLLVASLIRQESEWNPQVVSGANAYGLMQLLPSVGKQMAKKQGIRHFNTSQLLDASINLRLGTAYFKQDLDHFDGHVEYALAAYNAGVDRVEDWKTIGTYHDMPEFVESIPFSETRDYVQAILRNHAIYRRLHPDFAQRESSSLASSQDLH
jgi:soluble lytic murein transglycosylase